MLRKSKQILFHLSYPLHNSCKKYPMLIHERSKPDLSGFCIAQSLVLYVIFWRPLFVFICIIIEKTISTYIVVQTDGCMAVPNDIMVGREAILIFQEMNSYGPKMYTYQVNVIHIKYIDIESFTKSCYGDWFLFFYFCFVLISCQYVIVEFTNYHSWSSS